METTVLFGMYSVACVSLAIHKHRERERERYIYI